MEIIAHRINSVLELKEIPSAYGVEIDIRSFGSKLILNHEAYSNGDLLENYLENYKHKTLVVNIKESGIENDVINLIERFSISSYFLLDVEMPYFFEASNRGFKNLAVRFSEYENIINAKFFENKVDWIWIDTVNALPINKQNVQIINKFNSCLVCPERWNREKDIRKYKKILEKLSFYPTAVMTNIKFAKNWLD